VIYYLDTSALAKRYVAETGTPQVRALFRRRRRVAVSRLAYAELAAAVARLCREGSLTVRARDGILDRLDRDFGAVLVLEARAAIIREVPALVLRQPLRGYDAVHLASALALQREGAATEFWSADDRLLTAARSEGLRAINPA
jgi:predicted nucleic acid-binding protein